MTLKDIWIYRMTHIKNIPHVIKNGITTRLSKYRNESYISIGDQSLIETRNNLLVNVLCKSNEIHKINIGNHIPFYFGKKMPMLYVIQNGHNHVKRPFHASEIVYLVCNLVDFYNEGINFIFSNAHAKSYYTQFFDATYFPNIPTILDYTAIHADYWGNDQKLDLKLKKQAEVLFENDIPTEQIKGYICYNDSAKDQLKNFGILDKLIKISKEAYY